MVKGTCANCIFSSGSTVTGLRICRRHAPKTVEMTPNYAIAVNYTQTSTKWPVVQNVDWCGEWRGTSDE